MSHEVLAEAIRIELGPAAIDGDLHLPAGAGGLVVFAHGSGSSRFSRRNRAVAKVLQHAGFGTLLLDLLTRDEEAVDERTTEHRFNIPLLGERVIGVTDWIQSERDLRDYPIAFFGASTGAAAALIAAAARPAITRAVISRGGRPDLAAGALSRVEAPTLLIVGGDDTPVIEMNRDAMRLMAAPVTLEIVPGATHLFEEPGTLEQVARLAADWCGRHLGQRQVLVDEAVREIPRGITRQERGELRPG
jgi:putative phosphoribosyl transferase